MNTIEKLGDEETFKNIVERTITEFEDNEIEVIGDSAFSYCSALTSVSLPVATSIGSYAFQECSALTSVSLPAVTSIVGSVFYNCSALTSVSFPVATSIGSSAFYGCSVLTSVSFPVATSIGSSAFNYCGALTSVSLPAVTSIGDYVFSSCNKLTTMYIGTESDTVCTLSNTNAIPSNVSAIYVPYTLQEQYKTATNWSSFADKIQAYDIPISCQSLTITAEDVPWYKTSTIIHYEAVCTYSIEGMMQTGTKVFKGDIASDTFSTNTSEESSRQVEISYTFLGKTATTTITQGRYRTDLVGGAIFYIDSSADGVYEFYDINGELISNVTVGDKPYSYKVVTPGSKDKYYILHDEPYTSLRWTYYKDGSYVYNNLGTRDRIGTGKSNTATVLAADDGAYITADSNGLPTIWYQLQQVRNAFTEGNNDWFMPSEDEIREALKAKLIPYPYYNKYLWSSSEVSSSSREAWSVRETSGSGSDKSSTPPVFFTRAF